MRHSFKVGRESKKIFRNVQQTAKSSSVYFSKAGSALLKIIFLFPRFYSAKLSRFSWPLALTQLDLDAFAKHFGGISATLKTFPEKVTCLLRDVCL